jgi:hypothetical protein
MLILGLSNPQTPFEPVKFLSFIAMNHSLHYVLLKALFNRENNLNRQIALSKLEELFHKGRDFMN